MNRKLIIIASVSVLAVVSVVLGVALKGSKHASTAASTQSVVSVETQAHIIEATMNQGTDSFGNGMCKIAISEGQGNWQSFESDIHSAVVGQNLSDAVATQVTGDAETALINSCPVVSHWLNVG